MNVLTPWLPSGNDLPIKFDEYCSPFLSSLDTSPSVDLNRVVVQFHTLFINLKIFRHFIDPPSSGPLLKIQKFLDDGQRLDSPNGVRPSGARLKVKPLDHVAGGHSGVGRRYSLRPVGGKVEERRGGGEACFARRAVWGGGSAMISEDFVGAAVMVKVNARHPGTIRLFEGLETA
ncbi:uncharacterized protein LOC143186660 [Calliopsis andreniformis]|uniref:uncharacterized protein LOC143186660 n=1 Tax=Calliopsis andreniformis TaxID=337506 RepID=UPI003FCDA458